MSKPYYVYVMTNLSRTLYVGVTSDLERRVREHQAKGTAGFTQKYNITRLVHYETFTEAFGAIEREKQIKSWTRVKKLELVSRANPMWRDLSRDW